MRFQFDIKKALAAVAYLIQKSGGSADASRLLITVYLADKKALVSFGRPITGDNFISLPSGPSPEAISGLIKRQPGDSKNSEEWSRHISGRNNQKVKVLELPELDYLSDREIAMLDESFSTIALLKEDDEKWLRETFPEWQSPTGAPLNINPKDILKSAGKTDEEIAEIEGEIAELTVLKAFLYYAAVNSRMVPSRIPS